MPPVPILTKSYSKTSMYKSISNNMKEVTFLRLLCSALSTAIFLLLEGSCIEKQEASSEVTFHKVAFIAAKLLH